MNRRTILKTLATLPLVGFFFRPTLSTAAPHFELTSLSFRVTREELEATFSGDSGLIRRFRSAMQTYESCGLPVREKGLPRKGVVRSDMTLVTFRQEDGTAWGQPHEMLIPTEEILRNHRYGLVHRALDLHRRQCYLAGVHPNIDELVFVDVRFMHLPMSGPLGFDHPVSAAI